MKKGERQERYREVHISMDTHQKAGKDPQTGTHTKSHTRSGSIQRPPIAQVSAESFKRLEFTPCTNSYTGGKRSPPPNLFKLEPHPSSINLIPSLASSYFSFSSLPWVSLLSAQRNANTCTRTQECLCTHTNPQVSGFSRCLSPFPGSQT